jgi:hypothetical protein
MILGNSGRGYNVGPINMTTGTATGYVGYVAGLIGSINPGNWKGKALVRCADAASLSRLEIGFSHGGTPLPQNFWSTLDIQGMSLPVFNSASATYTPDTAGVTYWDFPLAGFPPAGSYILDFA